VVSRHGSLPSRSTRGPPIMSRQVWEDAAVPRFVEETTSS